MDIIYDNYEFYESIYICSIRMVLNFVIECLYFFTVAICYNHTKIVLRQNLVATPTCFVELGCCDRAFYTVAITCPTIFLHIVLIVCHHKTKFC
jgi:hypothetical protein